MVATSNSFFQVLFLVHRSVAILVATLHIVMYIKYIIKRLMTIGKSMRVVFDETNLKF